MEPVIQVGLTIPAQASFLTGVMEGFAGFVGPDSRWSLVHLRTRDIAPEMLTENGIACLLVQVRSESDCRQLTALDIPVVNIPTANDAVPLPSVCTDDEAVGALAAEHLLERAQRHFAMLRSPGKTYSDARERGFVERLREDGFVPSLFPPPGMSAEDADLDDFLLHPNAPALRWLKDLPKPVGLIAATDRYGRWLVNLCSFAGIHVPDEVAIVGVDNAAIENSVCWPNLSSVDPNFQAVGYEAACLLDELMQQPRNRPEIRKVVPPKGVAVRGSSDNYAVQDKRLNRALCYIRDHAVEKPTAKTIARACGVPSSTLNHLFRTRLGRTVHGQVKHLRLEMAASMIRNSNHPLADIAARLRFSSQQYMTNAFTRAFGLPPGEYRARHRAPDFDPPHTHR